MTEHDLSQRLEVGDDDRTVATAEVTTSAESGGTARVSLQAESRHIPPAAARAWSTRCWTCPKCAAAPAWKWRSGWAIPSHCGGFRNAARRSPPIRPAGVRSSTGTFLPAAQQGQVHGFPDMEFNIGRIQCHRPVIGQQGLINFAELAQYDTAVVEGAHMVGI